MAIIGDKKKLICQGEILFSGKQKRKRSSMIVTSCCSLFFIIPAFFFISSLISTINEDFNITVISLQFWIIAFVFLFFGLIFLLYTIGQRINFLVIYENGIQARNSNLFKFFQRKYHFFEEIRGFDLKNERKSGPRGTSYIASFLYIYLEKSRFIKINKDFLPNIHEAESILKERTGCKKIDNISKWEYKITRRKKKQKYASLSEDKKQFICQGKVLFSGKQKENRQNFYMSLFIGIFFLLISALFFVLFIQNASNVPLYLFLLFVIIVFIIFLTFGIVFTFLAIQYHVNHLIIYENGIQARSSKGFFTFLKHKYQLFDNISNINIKLKGKNNDIKILYIYIKNSKPIRIDDEFLPDIDDAANILREKVS